MSESDEGLDAAKNIWCAKVAKVAKVYRRILPIKVKEISEDEAYDMIKVSVAPYEEHHKVVYPDEALRLAVSHSAQYITSRLLPDKVSVINSATWKRTLHK